MKTLKSKKSGINFTLYIVNSILSESDVGIFMVIFVTIPFYLEL